QRRPAEGGCRLMAEKLIGAQEWGIGPRSRPALLGLDLEYVLIGCGLLIRRAQSHPVKRSIEVATSHPLSAHTSIHPRTHAERLAQVDRKLTRSWHAPTVAVSAASLPKLSTGALPVAISVACARLRRQNSRRERQDRCFCNSAM